MVEMSGSGCAIGGETTASGLFIFYDVQASYFFPVRKKQQTRAKSDREKLE
jgi:hypothetical protein